MIQRLPNYPDHVTEMAGSSQRAEPGKTGQVLAWGVLGQPQDTRGGHKRRVAWLWASIMRAPNSFPLRTFSKGNEHHTKCKRPRAARNHVVSGQTHVPLERPRRRRNTSKRKCSTAKASGKCSLQSRDEPWAAPSARVWPNSVDYTPNPELVHCSGVEMGFVSFVWPRSMRDLSSPTNTNGTCAPCSGSAWEVQVGFLWHFFKRHTQNFLLLILTFIL